jgi:hypothetical protein
MHYAAEGGSRLLQRFKIFRGSAPALFQDEKSPQRMTAVAEIFLFAPASFDSYSAALSLSAIAGSR